MSLKRTLCATRGRKDGRVAGRRCRRAQLVGNDRRGGSAASRHREGGATKQMAKALQHLLTRSARGKLLAARRVTENDGRKTLVSTANFGIHLRNNIADNHGIARYVRPAVAIIERRQDKKGDKSDREKEHNDPLLSGMLRHPPGAQAALQQRRVVFHEAEDGQERRREKDGEIRPALPIVERPRGDKNRKSYPTREKRVRALI
jgi:N-terminal domain of reverse transcriptase